MNKKTFICVLKQTIRQHTAPETIERARTAAAHAAYCFRRVVLTPPYVLLNPLNRFLHRSRSPRWLEIGPGAARIAGFETLNYTGGTRTDYVCDARKPLPFRDGTFDLVYASHIAEHIPWYQIEAALSEWVRIVKPGGAVEIWVPDALKIAKAFVAAEEEGSDEYHSDGWWRYNPEQDTCKWAAARFFSYGDGTGAGAHPNWHRGLFSPRYLARLMERSGLTDIRRMSYDEVRGYDHGWINLGLRGNKPPHPAPAKAESP
jgi:SAM-dependent methyltransferase